MRTLTLKEHLLALLGQMPAASPFGIVGQVQTPAELLRVANALRQAGYRRYDMHSPFPIHGMDRAMGLPRSRVPWAVLGAAATGCLAGLALQVWLHVFHYPLIVSGKPMFSLPAFIPIAFELTILFGAFGAILSMFVLNLLPMLYHPVFKHSRFARVTADGFFVVVEARDQRFDPESTRALLASLGVRDITLLEP